MNISCKILLVLFCVASQTAQSQFEQFYESWRWSHFTTASGLPSDVVEGIIETEDNIPWVTTAKGIAWYDGFRWNPIAVDSARPNLRARMISQYHHDKVFIILDGDLYVGNTKGFKKIIFHNQTVKGEVTTVAALDSSSFICVYETFDSAYVVKMKDGVDRGIASPAPGRVYRTNNTVWLSAGQDIGLYVYRDNSWSKLFYPIGEAIALRNIAENEKGEGVIAIDAPKNNIGVWEFRDKNNIQISRSERNQPVRAVDISTNAEVIVVYESGEIHVRHGNKWKNFDPIPRQMENILSLFFRQNNDIWFATEKGIYLFKRAQNEWKDQSYVFSDLRNVVMEVFRSLEGDLWIGNLNGLEIQRTNGNREYISEILGVKLGLVTGINQDVHGHIWICSGGGAKGVFEWNGSKWQRHFGEGINYHKIRKDRKGELWILGLGINNSDPAGYIITDSNYIRIDSLYRLPSNRLYSFIESKMGTKWIGTSEGLVRIKNNSTTKWGGESFGKNAKIYTMAVDKNENVWFSTFSSHLGLVEKNDSLKWILKRKEQYEYKEKIWDIVFDESGVLWVASSKGLYRYFNNTWTNYGAQTGSNIKELRVVLLTHEYIYVGGHGIGTRTIRKKEEQHPINIYLFKPLIENNEAFCSWSPESFWGKYPSDDIETRHRINNDDWSEWSTQHSIVLKGLQSGLYRLAVQAKDPYGTVYDASDEQVFEIEPHLYRRPIFLIPIIFLCLTIIALIIKYYQAKKQHQLNMLDQRIRISNDLHDDVGSNLGSISLISQRLSRKASAVPEIHEDLTIISDTAVQTAEELRDIVWYINPLNDSMINVNIRLREIAERQLRGFDLHFNLNDAVKNDNSLLNIRRNIISMYKEILHNVMKHSKAKNVSIKVDHQPDMFTIIVADDGVGFDHSKEYSGNGMRSIRRRVEEVNGRLNIESGKGAGTTITVVFSQFSKK
jgi:signal transduction histidine kinase/ligand-binding sensor domain-containing protein